MAVWARLRLAVAVAAALLLAAIGVGALQAQPPQGSPSPAPRPTGAIAGRVIDGVTNTPIAGALVMLGGTGLKTIKVIADPQGRFVFTNVAAGSFRLGAEIGNYLPGFYGALHPESRGRSLELRDGERVTDAVIRQWRYCAISGTVTDDAGDPVPYATVQAMKRTMIAGRWRLAPSLHSGQADERGVYRISSLTPGEYGLVITTLSTSLPLSLMEVADAVRRLPAAETAGVSAELAKNGTNGFVNDLMQKFPTTRVGDLLLETSGMTLVGADNQTIEAYPTIWYPDAATPAGASLVKVAAGEERSGIDLHPTLTKTKRVAGTVTGPDGPVAHLALRLVPASLDDAAAEISSSLALSLTTSLTASDAGGAFTFVGVPPGQYVIRALTSPRPPPTPAPAAGAPPPPFVLLPGEPALWAETPVSVGGGDTSGVAVSLRAGLRITGQVEYVGALPKLTPRELSQLPIYMDSADGRTTTRAAYQAQVDDEGRFATTGLPPGRYIVRFNRQPIPWTLKSAMLNGRDIADVPVTLTANDLAGLVLTFTDSPTTVAGSVRGAQGRPDEDAAVLVFPSDGNWVDLGPTPRRMRILSVARSGAFSTTGLPAGDYCVIAISEAQTIDWQDPAFLQKLSRLATRLTLADGQSINMPLTTVEGVVR